MLHTVCIIIFHQSENASKRSQLFQNSMKNSIISLAITLALRLVLKALWKKPLTCFIFFRTAFIFFRNHEMPYFLFIAVNNGQLHYFLIFIQRTLGISLGLGFFLFSLINNTVNFPGQRIPLGRPKRKQFKLILLIKNSVNPSCLNQSEVNSQKKLKNNFLTSFPLFIWRASYSSGVISSECLCECSSIAIEFIARLLDFWEKFTQRDRSSAISSHWGKSTKITKYISWIMPQNKDFLVLSAYRPFITYLTIYKVDNFRSDDWRILSRNIGRAIGVSILFIISFVFTLSDFFVSYDNNFALNKSVQNSIFVLILSQLPPIYIVVFRKSHKIINALDYLCGIVIESKLFLLLTNL